MKILLVRVGADVSNGGGGWNGPMDPVTRKFVYVPIPESHSVAIGLDKPYDSPVLKTALAHFGVTLPPHLRTRCMHLDPDFETCTYGDQGQRAAQLQVFAEGDLIVFYAGLRARKQERLVYALIGQLTVDRLVRASEVADRDLNAHTRREPIGPDDVIVVGVPRSSGRYEVCLPIGEYRSRAYRVRQDLLDEWCGISVKDGYLQRSARLPTLLQPSAFLRWLATHRVAIETRNY